MIFAIWDVLGHYGTLWDTAIGLLWVAMGYLAVVRVARQVGLRCAIWDVSWATSGHCGWVTMGDYGLPGGVPNPT